MPPGLRIGRLRCQLARSPSPGDSAPAPQLPAISGPNRSICAHGVRQLSKVSAKSRRMEDHVPLGSRSWLSHPLTGPEPSCGPSARSHRLLQFPSDRFRRISDLLDCRFELIRGHAEFSRPVAHFVVFARADARPVARPSFGWIVSHSRLLWSIRQPGKATVVPYRANRHSVTPHAAPVAAQRQRSHATSTQPLPAWRDSIERPTALPPGTCSPNC
jgi:hypothetical protein